eukprot:CAMPEP_0115890838 /NCGR_PEP_ID=MMETSP0287-20121206/33555_1 /TAXON_ID=412157 /ORGANISM="Chrysochromulina rotalis, Strain UIO044" /LENGTH=270 /DNA_ID=CAMNT_0003347617 /DNA_START=383 /DNA_END=1195 /DNA_ORIENTATION=-
MDSSAAQQGTDTISPDTTHDDVHEAEQQSEHASTGTSTPTEHASAERPGMPPTARTCTRPSSARQRGARIRISRPSTSGAASATSDAASAGYLEPLSQPCALQPRPCFTTEEQHRAPVAPDDTTDTDRGVDSSEAFDIDDTDDEFDPDTELAIMAAANSAARQARHHVCGPSAMQSRHTLPTAGNWVRLSSAKQHAVTQQEATARRRAAEGGFRSFGGEPRLSGSRRWAHQTKSGRTTARASGESAASAVGAAPGSFMPLKGCLSTMHCR